LNVYFSQGSVAPDLEGSGSFYSGFLRNSCFNLIMKQYELYCSIFAEVIVKISGLLFPRHSVGPRLLGSISMTTWLSILLGNIRHIPQHSLAQS